MDKEDYIRLKAYATATGQLERYVILKEDSDGRYIEYAFTEGAPHDNRCLSWYDKLQPKALKRNGHDIGEWASRLSKVGEIYELHHMCCGCDDKVGPEHCSAGHPKESCMEEGWAKSWTYKEPVKCACWMLSSVGDTGNLKIPLSLVSEYNGVWFSEVMKMNAEDSETV